MNQTSMGRKRLTPERIANRVKWVEALLSGDYAQGYGQLRTHLDDVYGTPQRERWCCLGVAGHCLEPNARFFDDAPAFLPRGWAFDKLGLTSPRESTVDLGDKDSDQWILSVWNDSRDKSFAHIADLIALATDKKQNLSYFGRGGVTPWELRGGGRPGDYAREWLERMKEG